MVPGTSLHELSTAIAAGRVTPVEATEAALARAAEAEPLVNAFVSLRGEEALKEARLLTRELAESGGRSPLHGVPIGVKDMIDVAGTPTRAGSKALLDRRAASADAAVVAALRSAGRSSSARRRPTSSRSA